MPKSRKTQVSLEATPYYHCVSRCVRRAFLCGDDSVSKQNFDHRRAWIEARMGELAALFAINVCAYSVMSNHYHVVLHVDAEQAAQWDTPAVIERWSGLFSLPLLVQRFRDAEPLSQAEVDVVEDIVAEWRARLQDISWFMRCLNEPIARQANEEDGCTGRFWEGRFKSQALLDEKALAACLAYVDLNPVRAGMSETPEDSAYTSIKARIDHAKSATKPEATQPETLLPFVGNPREPMPKGLPFPLADYLELVDWTGRILREDKKGAIPANTPPILQRLDIDPKYWLYMAQHFESRFRGLVGAAHKLKQVCQQLGYERTPNLSACRSHFH